MKIFEATALIPTGIMGAVLPAPPRDWAVSREPFAATFEVAFRYLTMLGVPLAAGGSICAAELVRLLYGPDYGPVGSGLAILMWAVVFSFWNHLLFAALIAMDRERCLLKIGAGGVVASLGCNLVLIPRYGALGSGAAAVLTQAFLFLLALRPVLRKARIGAALPAALLRPALCMGVMSMVLWLNHGRMLMLLIPTGIGLYLGGLLVTGAVRPAQLWALLGCVDQSREGR